jgi:hypothetical protein
MGSYDLATNTATAAKIPATAASSDPSPANTISYGLGSGVIIGKRGERLRDIVVTVSSWSKVGGHIYKTTFDITVLNQISLFSFSKETLADELFYFNEERHWSRERTNPTTMVVGDVDGNGLSDIVLGGSDGEIRLMNNLKGTTSQSSWNSVQVDLGSESFGWTTNSLVSSITIANVHGGTTIGPVVVPGTPELTATTSNQAVTITWSGPAIDGGSPITGYKVYISADGGHTYTTMVVTPVTLFHAFTGLTNYQTYWFKVSALNAMGEGSTAVISATPAPTIADAPTNLVATRGNAQVSLTWSAPAENGGAAIDYYIVYQNGADVAHVTTLSKTITGLVNGQSYSFAVAAHNSVGVGTRSASVSTTPATLPGQPINVLATAGKQGQSRYVDLSWSTPLSSGGSAITGYKIYYNWNEGSGTYSNSVTVSATTYAWSETGLAKGTQYRFLICALNEVGEGQGVTVTATTAS